MSTAPFPLSGLADEAADDIDGQIAAHQALGWSAIELRLLNGKQFSGPAVSDDDFKRAVDKIEAAGMRVSSYASAIGNWSRPITGDFATDLADLKASLDRLLALPDATVVHPGHVSPTTIGAERASNPFVRYFRGEDAALEEPVTAWGEPATLLVWGPDYDGGHKALVRWADGSEDIVGGSKVERG